MKLDPLHDGISSVELIQRCGSDKMATNAARVSFGGDNNFPLDERDEKLIRYLLQHRHGSPFEHNLITFKLVCPIFVDRQVVRHRSGVSKNEISGRYTEVKDQYYVPLQFRQQARNNRQASVEATQDFPQQLGHTLYSQACEGALKTYHQLLELGVTREQARGVLPQTMYTESYYSFNLRSLLHFLELRDHEGAQWETQQFARAMMRLAEPLFPVTFREWRAIREAQHG